MRIVIDTNVIASALFFGGKPAELIRQVIQKKHTAVVTQQIFEEYQETVDYLTEKYQQEKTSFSLMSLFSIMEIINSTTEVDVCRDLDDNKFISCAIDGQCYFIVSGDKDLLSLQAVRNIRIVTVAQFLEMTKP